MSTPPEVIKFEDPGLRRKRLAQKWAAIRSNHVSKPVNQNRKAETDAFDVEKTRFEILKFGIDNEKQRDKRLNAKKQLLLSLGAKAAKNEYVNYKKLKQELSVTKQCALHDADRFASGSSQHTQQRNSKRNKQDIDVTSGYGKLKNGELVVGADIRRTMKKLQKNAKQRQEQKKLWK